MASFSFVYLLSCRFHLPNSLLPRYHCPIIKDSLVDFTIISTSVLLSTPAFTMAGGVVKGTAYTARIEAPTTWEPYAMCIFAAFGVSFLVLIPDTSAVVLSLYIPPGGFKYWTGPFGISDVIMPIRPTYIRLR